MKRFRMLFVLISVLAELVMFTTAGAQQSQNDDKWNIKPSLKFDALCFIQAISDKEWYNKYYPRERDVWQGRLGKAVMDTINSIVGSNIQGFQLSYVFSFIDADNLNDIIKTLQNEDYFRKTVLDKSSLIKDYRHKATIKDLNRIISVKDKLIYVLSAMKDQDWEDDWKALRFRLIYDINRKQKDLKSYSPQKLKSEIDKFLGIQTQNNDSSTTVYYIYYAYPNAFKLPYNMFGTFSIENTQWFLAGYIHEMLHSFSIYDSQYIQLHENLVNSSKKLAHQEDILLHQFYESKDEFYVVAAESYLSVKLGIKTEEQAIHYLKTPNGGSMEYSLLLYNYLQKYFDFDKYTFGSFLKNIFFKNVTAKEIEDFITK